MNSPENKTIGVRRLIGRLSMIVSIGLIVLAIVAAPYRFNYKTGWSGTSVALADDGGHGDSGGDGGNGGDDGDDGGDSGDNDAGYHDDHNDNRGFGDDSESGPITAGDHDGGPGGLTNVGGLQGLSPVSPDDEAALVGNWGDED